MVRSAGTSSPATTAAAAGKRNTQNRAPSCHFLGSFDVSQYSPPSKAPSATNAISTVINAPMQFPHIEPPRSSPEPMHHHRSVEVMDVKRAGAVSAPALLGVSRWASGDAHPSDAQLAGQLASTLSTKVWVSPPMTHAVISVQNEPAPTAPGIRSDAVEPDHSDRVLHSVIVADERVVDLGEIDVLVRAEARSGC